MCDGLTRTVVRSVLFPSPCLLLDELEAPGKETDSDFGLRGLNHFPSIFRGNLKEQHQLRLRKVESEMSSRQIRGAGSCYGRLGFWGLVVDGF